MTRKVSGAGDTVKGDLIQEPLGDAKYAFNAIRIADTNLNVCFVVEPRFAVNRIAFDKDAFDRVNRWHFFFVSNQM